MPKAAKSAARHREPLVFLHVGDLHLRHAGDRNADDLDAILAQIAALVPQDGFDFVYLPGDIAEDGDARQYDILDAALARHPSLPVRLIPGDHDRQHGTIGAFAAIFRGIAGSERGGRHRPVTNALPQPESDRDVEQFYYAETVRGVRCLFLDIVSAGFGRKRIGLDFRLGAPQTNWLRKQIAAAARADTPVAVFMHAYPDDLREPDDRLDVAGLFWEAGVRLVEMGHTHYNELAHDGRTLYAAARSVGQNEDGSVGYAVSAIDGPATSWRFKALDRPWPFVLITSPADRRVATRPAGARSAGLVPDGRHRIKVRAVVLSDLPPKYVHCRAGTGAWRRMTLTAAGVYEAWLPWPPDARSLQVEAVDARWPGHGPDYVDTDVIEPVAFTDGDLTPPSIPDKPGSDAFAVGRWLRKGVRGDQLGPNRAGRKW